MLEVGVHHRHHRRRRGQNALDARAGQATPADVKARLDQLARGTQADEIMITSPIYDHEARKASYALMAEAYKIAPQAAHEGANA